MSDDKKASFAYARVLLNRITEDLHRIGFDDAEWQSFSEGYELYMGGYCVARGVDAEPAIAAEELIEALAWFFSAAPKA